MFRFYRKLRQSMFQNGDTSKYFKYAIGEIFLVVVGILIALQINNWNEDRKSRIQEIKYLKNLKKDISLELINNDSIIKYRAATAKAAAKMLSLNSLSTVEDLLELEFLIQQVFKRVDFIPTNNTYKELLSSGNLNFITNDSIKEYLLELDKDYVEIANIEYHMYREYEEYLYNTAVKKTEIINLFDFQKTGKEGVLIYKETSKIPFKKILPQYTQLLTIKEFKNGLRLSVMNNVALKMKHSEITTDLLTLIELLEEDIKKN